MCIRDRDRAEAEDVVQDTMIRVWNKRDEWSQFESVEALSLIHILNCSVCLWITFLLKQIRGCVVLEVFARQAM